MNKLINISIIASLVLLVTALIVFKDQWIKQENRFVEYCSMVCYSDHVVICEGTTDTELIVECKQALADICIDECNEADKKREAKK